MSRRLKYRLSMMMFLQYCVPGATVPILSHYLKDFLHFEPLQVGLILAMSAIAAFFAPFMMSHIADRFISSERVLALCHVVSAALMVCMSRQTSFIPFLGLFFAYGLAFAPTFGLTNTIALHHVPDARRDFGGIRMWGTAGWVVVAWLFGFLWVRGGGGAMTRLPHALYVSALMSCVLAAYAFALPRSHVRAEGRTSLMYWSALRVFARPSLWFLCVVTFCASMSHQFYYYGMSPFLSQSGYSGQYIMPAMSIGQISEVVVLGLLGLCLARLSMKRAMMIGLLTQVLRYVLFAAGAHPALLLAGIVVHGICYAFFFTTAYLYVDRHSTAETRAGAQQLFTVVISGLGVLAGNLSAGWTAQMLTVPGSMDINYAWFWIVPAVLSAVTVGAIALLLREEPAAAGAL